MQIEDIKRIRLYRQHLTNKADKLTVVHDLCGVQAQFMASAIHSLRLRATDFDEATVGEGLVKNWTVRGTVHVFAKDDLPLFLHCNNGKDYRRNEWYGNRFWNTRDSWELSPERQKFLVDVILAALSERSRTREELKDICRAAGMTKAEEAGMFEAWGGGMRELCERGFLNYTVEEKKVFCLSPDFTPIPEDKANLEICRRYLLHMAPATLQDICYYFKCPQKRAMAWLSALNAESLNAEGREYFYLGEIVGDYPDVPRCIFLAGFDQLMLAYEKKHSLYLPPEFLRGIFNLAGIVMPALLLDGLVCGRWKRSGRRLDIFSFRALSEKEKRDVRVAAEVLWREDMKIEFQNDMHFSS